MSLPAFFLPGWGLGCGPMQVLLEGSQWQIMDLPGMNPEHSLSPIYLPKNLIDARDAVLAQLPPCCHLGGWSLGAILALACAAHAPERIASLTLIAATPSFIRRPDWVHGLPPEQLTAFTEGVQQDGAAIFPRFIGNFCRGDLQARACTQALLRYATPASQAALVQGLGWLAEADLRQTLSTITCPVRLLHGENDPLIPLAAARWLENHLSNVQMKVIPHKAHAPFAPFATPETQHFADLLALP